MLSRVEESQTLANNQVAKEMRRQGKKVFHFGFGESPFPVPKPIEQEMVKHAYEKKYCPGTGIDELKEAISTFYQEQYNLSYKPAHIIPGNGSKQIIY